MPAFSTKFTRISVNGQSYNSLEEMPPDVRKQYEEVMSKLADADHNGIPDILEGKPDPTVKTVVTTTQQRFMVNGQEFTSLADIPQALRHLIESALPSSPQLPPEPAIIGGDGSQPEAQDPATCGQAG